MVGIPRFTAEASISRTLASYNDRTSQAPDGHTTAGLVAQAMPIPGFGHVAYATCYWACKLGGGGWLECGDNCEKFL